VNILVLVILTLLTSAIAQDATITLIRPGKNMGAVDWLFPTKKGMSHSLQVSKNEKTCDTYGTQLVTDNVTGKDVARIKQSHVVVLNFQPGTYQFRTKRSPVLTVQLEPGKNYTVWPRQTCHWTGIYRDELTLVPEDEVPEMMEHIRNVDSALDPLHPK
jgi:hypothetical protein